MGEEAAVVLVHGAFCGDWAYWKIGPQLTKREIRWTGADLPSCRATDASVTAADDAAYVRELIDEIDGPVVVVGKSYGGIVVSGASAGPPNVAHLVYVAAMVPAPGEQYLRMTGPARQPEFVEGFRLLEDGRVAMHPEVGAQCAFSQATEEDRDSGDAMPRRCRLGAIPRCRSNESAGKRSHPRTSSARRTAQFSPLRSASGPSRQQP